MKNIFKNKENKKNFYKKIIRNFIFILIFIFSIFYDISFANSIPIFSGIVFLLFIVYRFSKKILR